MISYRRVPFTSSILCVLFFLFGSLLVNSCKTKEAKEPVQFEKEPESAENIYTFLGKTLPGSVLDTLCLTDQSGITLLIQYGQGKIAECEVVSSSYDDQTNQSIRDVFKGRSEQFGPESGAASGSYQIELDPAILCKQLNYTFIKDSGQ